jgi:hypothetical protein
MISRTHVEPGFFEDAEAMRATLDASFQNRYADKIAWYYFCDPRMYTYLRAAPKSAFPEAMFGRFMQRLRDWCVENLGLVPMGVPHLHMMVNGCRLGLHSDYQNGAWGYVYSLTRWDKKNFHGGETLLLRDGIPSYKKHHVHGEVLYELMPANFNQLLIFDDRIVHATPTIEGSMDPMEARIAMVGHIRATSPLVSGGVSWAEARSVIAQALPGLKDRLQNHKEVQGTISWRLSVTAAGAVESVTALTDNLVTPVTGYERSEAVAKVRAHIYEVISRLRFPSADQPSSIIVPVLVPLPDLRPIEYFLSHDLPVASAVETVARHLAGRQGLALEGSWDGPSFIVHEPLAGVIRVERSRITLSFDAPMWVPSQREAFKADLVQWAGRLVPTPAAIGTS